MTGYKSWRITQTAYFCRCLGVVCSSKLPRILSDAKFVNKAKKKGRGCLGETPTQRVANYVGPPLLFGNEPELLHHAQIIVGMPLLD